MQIKFLFQNTDEWQEYRKGHFNASEVGDLFGVGFNGREKLAHIKYGDLKVFQNEAMKRGQEAEENIRFYANFVSDNQFEPAVFVYDDDTRLSASLDGINEKGDEICELKSSKNEFDFIKANNKPSLKYFLQVQQQLLCSGAKKCYFVAQNPEEKECVYCIVLPNEEVQKEILKKWDEFEKEFKDKPLPLLEKVINENNDNLGIKALTDDLTAILAQKQELQAQENEIKKQLIDMANGEKTKFYNILVFPVNRTTTDYKKFLMDNKLNVSKEYEKTTTSWAIKLAQN